MSDSPPSEQHSGSQDNAEHNSADGPPPPQDLFYMTSPISSDDPNDEDSIDKALFSTTYQNLDQLEGFENVVQEINKESPMDLDFEDENESNREEEPPESPTKPEEFPEYELKEETLVDENEPQDSMEEVKEAEYTMNEDNEQLPTVEDNEQPQPEQTKDDDMAGLFEDSDESEHVEPEKVEPVKQKFEEKPPVPEVVREVIDTTLNVLPKPEDENLMICKFPPTLVVSCLPSGDIRSFLKSNPQLLENPPTEKNLSVLYWKNTEELGEENKLVSNSKLVEWDDGTHTLFVGKIPLDLEFLNESSFLVEDSKQDLKPVHAQINTRIQTRFSNLLKKEYIKKNVKVKRQKMELTSLTDAISSQHTLQRNLNNMKETQKMKRPQHSKGLTRNFLESSDNEDD